MILLDTNVVSEATKPEPHPAVIGWLDAQAAETGTVRNFVCVAGG